MFKGVITIKKDGTIEGDPILFSIIQTRAITDKKQEIELKGSPWCG